MVYIMGGFLHLGVLGQEGILWLKVQASPTSSWVIRFLLQPLGLAVSGGGSFASSLCTKAVQIWLGLFSASERSLNRYFWVGVTLLPCLTRGLDQHTFHSFPP